MMKKTILLVLFSCILTFNLLAQSTMLVGKVQGTDGVPIEGAIFSVSDRLTSVISGKDGSFQLPISDRKYTLKIVAEGYYDKEYPLSGNVIPKTIILVPVTEVKYNGSIKLPDYTELREYKSASTQGVKKMDLKKDFTIDLAMQDEVTGLKITRKSGMPGEGGYLNLRGIHSLVAGNSPLIVVNGVPHFGNEEISDVINGYSRNTLFGFNTQDIRNITVLKGADAAVYGSLGSNGVILIETEQATSNNLETRISFNGQYGFSLPNRSIPVLGVSDYKTYLQDIGMTRYSLISSLYTDYPFLQNTENYDTYLFNNKTDWNKEVQSPAFVTDNVFRVEGGDEIAKYNIAFGYSSEGGVLGNTSTNRYHTLINSNIMVSRNVDIFTNVGLYYVNSNLQEQGSETATNAITSSYLMMPMLSPFKKEPNGNILNGYSTYNGWNVVSNPTFAYDNVSNPVAIVNTVDATDKIYDANIRLGLNYRANRYLTLTGMINLYYNYTEESIFIPGVTDRAIVPQYYNTGLNTVRKGVIQNSTNYYGLSALYKRTFNDVHQVLANLGVRYMNRLLEYDRSAAYNTPNDYNQTLGTASDDKDISGNNVEWKWLNYNLHTDYIYNHLLKYTFNLAVDGTSVSGVQTDRFGLFPSLGVTFMTANLGTLPSYITLLNVTAEVSRTGNSRFSSNYSKNYYQNSNFFNLGTITRSNVPNTKLQWEKKDQLDLGLDLSMFDNKLNLQVNGYSANSFDLLVARNVSSVYGSSQYFDNVGQISTKGLEVSFRLNPIHTKDIDVTFGASASQASSIVKSLGNSTELITSLKSFNGDDAMIMLREGQSPYQFYGYRTNGVYATTDQAVDEGLLNIYGKPYQAGDVRFVDEVVDGTINAKDKVLLGSAAPDFFGGMNLSLRYKQFSLLTEFGYSVGNKAYNALRRNLESMQYFYNQSGSVLNRWQIEGQETTMPRASYGDPSGNNLFSDRWIEDASYLKLRSITLRYDFKNGLLHFCRQGSVYLVAENLYTLTDYLGSDPEFSYSNNEALQGIDYAKVSLPITVKMGVSLNF
jgi:TonB-linked SusC/RagA family outer membrane protein